jgi:hypothetical protein
MFCITEKALAGNTKALPGYYTTQGFFRLYGFVVSREQLTMLKSSGAVDFMNMNARPYIEHYFVSRFTTNLELFGLSASRKRRVTGVTHYPL